MWPLLYQEIYIIFYSQFSGLAMQSTPNGWKTPFIQNSWHTVPPPLGTGWMNETILLPLVYSLGFDLLDHRNGCHLHSKFGQPPQCNNLAQRRPSKFPHKSPLDVWVDLFFLRNFLWHQFTNFPSFVRITRLDPVNQCCGSWIGIRCLITRLDRDIWIWDEIFYGSRIRHVFWLRFLTLLSESLFC
jgi:hypothetical protein